MSAPSDREKSSPSTATPSSQSQSKIPKKSQRMVSNGSEPASSASPSLRRSARLKSRGSATDGDDKSGSLCKNGDEGTGFDVDEGNASGSLSGSGKGGSGKNKKEKVRVLGGSDSVEEMEVVEEPGGGDVEKELNLNVVEEIDKGSSGSGSGKGRKRKTRASSGSRMKGKSGSACFEDDVKKSDAGGVENEGVLKVDNDDEEGSECGDVREKNSVEMGNSRFMRSVKKKDSDSYSVKGEEGGNEIDGKESTDTMVDFRTQDLISRLGMNVGDQCEVGYRAGEGEQGAVNNSGKGVDVEIMGDDTNHVASDKRRYSRAEKGKETLVEESGLSIGVDQLGLNLSPGFVNSIEDVALTLLHMEETMIDHDRKKTAKEKVRENARRMRREKKRSYDAARESAGQFARFEGERGADDALVPTPESIVASSEADQAIEDWPGPFSTAMKIINDRKLNVRQNSSTSDRNKPTVTIEWTPSKYQRRTALVPSLFDLSLKALAKYAKLIVSLEGVPDLLRNKLSQLLCDSRKMDGHTMELLVRGSPTEIRMKDCSWMTEEQITTILRGCNTNKLTVLQLDQCGRCLPDYIVRNTLAKSTNSMPSLVSISLTGACRLTDDGLNALITSAPQLRSVNLGQCSLITSTGIYNMVISLGSLVRELYLDDCQNIDAMLILPALVELQHLEVLSLTGINTVCDDFMWQLMSLRGPTIKELVLANCSNLTDSAVEAIAKACCRLNALDIFNVHRLTDVAIGHLANGSRSLQALKLGCNAFSDEAIAAFLEASGESLIELSLNKVNKVGFNTAVSISRRCSRNLQSLDLSWCRNMTDDAVGLIVDSCLSVRLLKLFGCTQITRRLLDGHSNPLIHIIGLKMTPVLEQLDIVDHRVAPLRYSAVPPCAES